MDQRANEMYSNIKATIEDKPHWLKEYRIELDLCKNTTTEITQITKHVVDKLRADGVPVQLMSDDFHGDASSEGYFLNVCNHEGPFGLKNWWCQRNAAWYNHHVH